MDEFNKTFNPEETIKLDNNDILETFFKAFEANQININKFLENEDELLGFLEEYNVDLNEEQLKNIHKSYEDIKNVLLDKNLLIDDKKDQIKHYIYNTNNIVECHDVETNDHNNYKYILFILLVIIIVCIRRKRNY